MSSYGSGRDRDPYIRDGPSRDPRARSRSPPSHRAYHEREKVVARINRVDPDAAPKSLPRKPGTATNSVPVNSNSSHPYASASTSSSSSTRDPHAFTYRPQHSDRPESSAAARSNSSAAMEPPADLVARLYAAVPERQLFEQINLKSFAIFEDRRALEDQLKKLKSVQDWLAKAGSSDPKNTARLTEQQQAVARLEQKIRADSDELYRMQLRWQVEMTAQILPSMLPAATAPLIEAKLQDLSQEVKTERDKDRKLQHELDNNARTHFGQINRLQSDINKVKSDVSALIKDADRSRNKTHDTAKELREDVDKHVAQIRTEIQDTGKKLRKDVDRDVAQINENSERIRRLEKKLATVQQDHAARPTAGPPSAATTSVRHSSTTPSSPGAASLARSRATSPPHDPRVRPAQQSAAATDTASPSAATVNAPSAHYPPASTQASSSASESKPVTQAQFRKFAKDLDQDLELRFDEIKALAVQEATDENQACIEERIRALARRWRAKALRGEDATGNQDHVASIANADSLSEQAAASTTTTAAAGAADGATPMEIETVQQPKPASDAAVSSNASVSQTKYNGATRPISSHATSAVVEQVPVPNATSQAVPTAGSTLEEPKTSTSNVSATQPGPAAATHENSLSSMLSQPGDPKLQSAADAGDGTKAANGSMPADLLKDIRVSLKHHGTQLAAVQQDIDALRSFEKEWVVRLINSPDKLEQVWSALKDRRLGDFSEYVGAAITSLGNNVIAIQNEIAAMRTSEDESKGRIQALEDAKQQMVNMINEKVDWVQRHIEVLDDQSSLQAALLVKLCEHANPRRPRPKAISINSDSGVASRLSAVQSPVVEHAQHASSPVLRQAQHQQQQPRPQLHHQPMLTDAMTRPRPTLDQAATALSAHMQPVFYPQQQPAGQTQPYQPVPQQQQQQQHQSPYAMHHAPYPYQDPNQRQGYH